ncbi:MAG: hypothetical protein HY699_11065 [Deltaproteobacteria bacterium]|nr:hypothetical protein [Deltaproteobacteria bacterium]
MRESIVGERDSRLFQPDVLLPAQFFSTLRRKAPQEPERRLVVAILEDAVDCFHKHLFARDHKARQLFEDSEAWILSDDRDWPFSFANICELLDLNPEYLRRGLLTWKERQLAERSRGKVINLEPYAAPDDSNARVA